MYFDDHGSAILLIWLFDLFHGPHERFPYNFHILNFILAEDDNIPIFSRWEIEDLLWDDGDQKDDHTEWESDVEKWVICQ